MTEVIDGEVIESRALVLPTRDSAHRQLVRVREFQATVRELFVQDHDYGVIPGTQKPTLLKPGAEKLAKLLGLADHYNFVEKTEDWDRGFFNYTVRCSLDSMDTGRTVAEGLGNCNSWESKYRWRWLFASEASEEVKRTAPKRTINTKRGQATQYRVENEDIYSQVNTVIKMAKKRALVDAALSAGRLSDIFTQDMEDVAGAEPQNATSEAETPVAPPPEAAPPEMPSADDLEAYGRGIKLAESLGIDLAPFEAETGITRAALLALSAKLVAAVKDAEARKAAAPA